MRVYEEIRKKIRNVRHKNVVNVVFIGKFITLNTYLYKKETLKVSNVCFQVWWKREAKLKIIIKKGTKRTLFLEKHPISTVMLDTNLFMVQIL